MSRGTEQETARRARAEAFQAAERARARRRRGLVVGGAVLALIVLAGVIGFAVQTGRNDTVTSIAGTTVPRGAGPAGGVVVGQPSAPVQLTAYEDPQCPICERFETTAGSTLDQLVAKGDLKIRYIMLSFIGPESVRADNALDCAADQGKFAELRDTLFANQPRERTGGYTNDILKQLGAKVGLTNSAYARCVDNGTYTGFVRAVGDQASKDGITGTPTILVGGQPVANPFDLKALTAAIQDAKAKA